MAGLAEFGGREGGSWGSEGRGAFYLCRRSGPLILQVTRRLRKHETSIWSSPPSGRPGQLAFGLRVSQEELVPVSSPA